MFNAWLQDWKLQNYDIMQSKFEANRYWNKISLPVQLSDEYIQRILDQNCIKAETRRVLVLQLFPFTPSLAAHPS